MQRILIVEDEQKTGRYLQQGLVEEGYQADLFLISMHQSPIIT